MKMIDKPTVFALENVSKEGEPQIIQFVEKEFDEKSGQYKVTTDGTIAEEMVDVLIAYVSEMEKKTHFDENVMILESLVAARNWMDVRRRKSERIQAKLRAAANPGNDSESQVKDLDGEGPNEPAVSNPPTTEGLGSKGSGSEDE